MYAALYCSQYTFKNGNNGYLGACGEIYTIYQNVVDINTAMDRINGTPLPTSNNDLPFILWSST